MNRHHGVPRVPAFLLRALPPRHRQHVAGDLVEEYTIHVLPRLGRLRAAAWFWMQLVRTLVVGMAIRAARVLGAGPGRRGPEFDEDRGPPHRPTSFFAWIGDLLQDLRYTSRSIAREPGFTATAVLTIAIGIAATTTIFSLVDGILLRPMGYPDPNQIVAVWPTYWFSNNNFNILERDLLADDSSLFTAIAGYSPRSAQYRDAEGTRSFEGLRVTARFFDVLGPVMTLGRTFDPDANELGNERVAVVSHGFWQRELGGDPEIIGQTITLENAAHIVVGVLAPGYDLLVPGTDIVMPKAFDPNNVRYSSAEMKGLGRLKPGTTVEQGHAELQVLLANWREEYGLDDDFGADFAAEPFRDFLVGDARPTLALLFGSVTLILLIASANVVNLLLTRGIKRQREVSVRIALGARPFRVMRQLFTESTVLALLGGAAGLIGSVAAVRGVVALLPPDMPRLNAIQVDGRVIGFAVALALSTGWIVSIAPALRLLAVRFKGTLSSTGRGVTGRQYMRRAIVAGEIGLAVMLLTGAGLLVKSFWQLAQVDPGIRADGLVTFYANAERGRLASHDEATVFHNLVFEQLTAIPGVSGVSTISQAPYNQDGGVVGCRPFDDADPEADNQVRCRWRSVGPGYFDLAGTTLLEGRAFDPDDTEGSEQVAVISRATADELFPAGGALGGRVATGFEEAVEGGQLWATVVGIVADVRFLGLAEESPLLVYRPVAQEGAISDEFGFYGREYVVRAEADAASLEAVRGAVHRADPTAVVAGYNSMDRLIAASVRDRRAVLILMSSFTAAAVLLGMIGIFGITSFGVRSRSRELGIKIALGASRRNVVAEVLVGGSKVATAGALIGLGLALALARFIESFLYGVESSDPWVAVSAVSLALAISLLATWIPARRAASVDPIVVLTTE